MAWGLGGLDLTLASAGRFLHLCCCQLQRLQLCIQEWYHGFSAFLGRVSGWRADSLHFRPRLKDLFLTHGSATRVPRNIQVDWMEWKSRGNDTWTAFPSQLPMETSFICFTYLLLNSLEQCPIEWWHQRRQATFLMDVCGYVCVRLFSWVFCNLRLDRSRRVPDFEEDPRAKPSLDIFR